MTRPVLAFRHSQKLKWCVIIKVEQKEIKIGKNCIKVEIGVSTSRN